MLSRGWVVLSRGWWSALVEADRIGDRDNGITIDGVITTEIRAIEHIRNTIAVKNEIAVVVTTHHTLYIILTEYIRHLVPVIHIAIAQWIVSKHKDRCSWELRVESSYLAFARTITRRARVRELRDTIQIMLEPRYILWSHMAICHTDNRTWVKPYKIRARVRESKSTITENTGEIHDTRLRPSGLVVARCRIIWHTKLIQSILDSLNRSTVTRLS